MSRCCIGRGSEEAGRKDPDEGKRAGESAPRSGKVIFHPRLSAAGAGGIVYFRGAGSHVVQF